MVKRELIDLIRNRLDGSPKQIHEEVVSYSIATAVNTIFFKYFKNINLDVHCKSYVCDVLKNEFDEYYFPLPERIVNIPDIPSGIRRISRTNGDRSEFLPVTLNSTMAFDNLELNNLVDQIGYRIEQPNVVLWNHNPDVTKVKVWLVKPFEKYEDDEEFVVPSGADLELVDMTVKFLTGQPIGEKQNG